MAGRKAGSGSAEDKVLSELYLGDLEAFTARRNELVKEIRGRGDGEGAERVRKLKKPSRVAWAINQLSGQEPAVRDELLDAGAALRKAHERLMTGKAKGAELREASEQEQAAVTKALDAVTALSESAGARLSPAAVDRARQTLHAVSLDDDVRRDFERHRLTTEHDPSGLGAFSVDRAASSPRGGGKTPAKDADRRESKRRRNELKAAEAKARTLGERERAAELEIEEARQAAERARRHLKRATKAHEKAASDATASRARVEELRERSD